MLRKAIWPVYALSILLASEMTIAGCEDVADYNFEPADGTRGVLVDMRVNADSPTTGENWHEDHCSGGDLFKVGDGSSVDPYRRVGSWIGSRSGPTVTYNYGDPDGPYIWDLFVDGDHVCWDDPDTGSVIAIGTLESSACTP